MMNNMYDILAKINLLEGRRSKPDFLDLDSDGNRKEPMKKAAREKNAEAVEEGSTGDYSAKKARAGKDIGKPGKTFAKIARSAGERYGSKERGEKVAGAVLAKLRAKEDVNEADMDESALQAYLGKKKYGEEGMKALQKAGRDGASKQKMAQIRAQHDKMDEADMGEGNEFSGALANAKKSGAKEFEVDGKKYAVKEAAKPDYIDLDRDGNKKESMKKAAQDKKKHMKESLRLVKETAAGDRTVRVYHDREYQEYHVCVAEGDQVVSRQFAGSTQEASDLVRSIVSEARAQRAAFPGTDEYKRQHGTDIEAFRLRHAPSVMKDPEARKGLAKMDTEHERLKKMRRGEIDPDELGDEPPAGEKRGRGRPKGSKRAIGAKGPTGRSKLLRMEEDYDKDEYDEEGEMAKSQARTIEDAAQELQDILDDDENLPEWVQKKIVLAKEYIDSARDYMKANPDEEDMDVDVEVDDEEIVAEKAVSKAQRAAAGIAYAARKGDIPKSELRGASREMAKMPAGELKKFAKTKEKGLPEKVKEVDTGEADARKTMPASKDQQEKIFARHRERVAKEKQDHDKEKPVKETTTAGSVATAPAEGEKKSKGGIQFGKGVYEARLAETFAAEMDRVLAEGTTITINSPDHGEPSVSVNGTGADATALSELLKMAGLFSSGGYRAIDGDDTCSECGGAGMHEAGCGRGKMVEADLANSGDNTETMDTDYMVNKLAGGLNGPKLQVNPNNPGDNAMAMTDLGKRAAASVNLGAIAEQVEQDAQQRLLDLYRKIS